MNEELKKILDDLYALDPNLKEFESEIIKIIDAYMKSKPDTKFDAEFVSRLRTEILEKAKSLNPLRKSGDNFSLFFNKFSYALIGAAAVMILIIPVTFYINKNKGAVSINGQKLALDYKPGISKVAGEAFGPLLAGSATGQSQTLGLGGGGNGAAPKALSETARSSDSGVAMDSAKIVPPYMDVVNYKYIYEGDEIKQDQPDMPVYKRIKSGLNGASISQIVTGIESDLINLSKFSDGMVSNINLNEEKEYGYTLSLNFTDGIISIFQNWAKWPQPGKDCRDQACFDALRVKYEDVPADSNLIAIADSFVKDYGIEMTPYGQPYVMDAWRIEYARVEDKSQVYIPEELTVNYPLVINGQTVYDESGNPSGLFVNVNFRYNKVTSISEIKPQTYESSGYKAVTDSGKILEVAQRGGLYGDYQAENPTKTVEIKLGTPVLALMRYYSYNNDAQTSDELFIPCYVFPINSISDTSVYFYKKNIVVPLAEDILKEVTPITPGSPEPFMLKGETSGSTGAAGAAESEPKAVK